MMNKTVLKINNKTTKMRMVYIKEQMTSRGKARGGVKEIRWGIPNHFDDCRSNNPQCLFWLQLVDKQFTLWMSLQLYQNNSRNKINKSDTTAISGGMRMMKLSSNQSFLTLTKAVC
ncbi:hypothetical protein KQX54_005202 [Cotesia glomerata]|uniref:Uncharacterized protein n=1 Tax=Cotesia glomerata TaxID=32391 RepID=A0AAV7I992_COTGL|nr:hypothetical protein KQX54_005202 [Cotesia glomerata]